MLLIATKIGPSKINGIGVFAAEPVAVGQAVWRRDVAVDICLFADAPVATLQRHAYLTTNGWVLCLDNASWMNHSDAPTVLSVSAKLDVAARGLVVGDELTIDYRTFDLDWQRKLEEIPP